MAQSTSSAGNQPLIELRHVDKHYGDLHVLNDINLSCFSLFKSGALAKSIFNAH